MVRQVHSSTISFPDFFGALSPFHGFLFAMGSSDIRQTPLTTSTSTSTSNLAMPPHQDAPSTSQTSLSIMEEDVIEVRSYS